MEQREIKSFVKVKKLFCTPDFFAHYNVNFPLIVACDAPPYGVGAVLSQKYFGLLKICLLHMLL